MAKKPEAKKDKKAKMPSQDDFFGKKKKPTKGNDKAKGKNTMQATQTPTKPDREKIKKKVERLKPAASEPVRLKDTKVETRELPAKDTDKQRKQRKPSKNTEKTSKPVERDRPTLAKQKALLAKIADMQKIFDFLDWSVDTDLTLQEAMDSNLFGGEGQPSVWHEMRKHIGLCSTENIEIWDKRFSEFQAKRDAKADEPTPAPVVASAAEKLTEQLTAPQTDEKSDAESTEDFLDRRTEQLTGSPLDASPDTE